MIDISFLDMIQSVKTNKTKRKQSQFYFKTEKMDQKDEYLRHRLKCTR